MMSSLRVSVPFVLDAPTVRTHGAFAGAVMPPVLQLARRVLAEVAGGGDDDNAAVGERLGGERQRVGPVRLGDRARRPTC